jgi:hypothetical protein
MTYDIRVGRGSKIAQKIRRYRLGQGWSKLAKKRGTSLKDVPQYIFDKLPFIVCTGIP